MEQPSFRPTPGRVALSNEEMIYSHSICLDSWETVLNHVDPISSEHPVIFHDIKNLLHHKLLVIFLHFVTALMLTFSTERLIVTVALAALSRNVFAVRL